MKQALEQELEKNAGIRWYDYVKIVEYTNEKGVILLLYDFWADLSLLAVFLIGNVDGLLVRSEQGGYLVEDLWLVSDRQRMLVRMAVFMDLAVFSRI